MTGIFSPVAHGRGGIHVSYHKHTMDQTPIRMPNPQKVVLPMQQHIGAPCLPIVNVGDYVKLGQKIGDTDAYLSAPIHASVSGTVTEIGPIRLASGKICTGITIESDGKMTRFEGNKPPVITNKQEFLAAVRESGLVGMGGAGFPTHAKLNIPQDKHVDTIIVNAAECEPYITVDYREALDNSWDVLSGVHILKEFLGIKNIIIAIEDNKPEALKVLKAIADAHQAIANAHHQSGDGVKIVKMKSNYPQGAEKMIILSATGRRVPEGGLPIDVGCIVMNITTVAILARYIKTGRPLTTRSLTVDGTAMNKGMNVRVPLGTTLQDILDFCGGFKKEPKKVVFGGPMMGSAIYELSAPLCKPNNSILAFAEPRIKKETACINCGRCASVCPMSLAPTFIAKAAKISDTERLKKLGAMSCMECGCCAYSCPAGKPLVQHLRQAKQLIREEKK